MAAWYGMNFMKGIGILSKLVYEFYICERFVLFFQAWPTWVQRSLFFMDDIRELGTNLHGFKVHHKVGICLWLMIPNFTLKNGGARKKKESLSRRKRIWVRYICRLINLEFSHFLPFLSFSPPTKARMDCFSFFPFTFLFFIM